MITVILFLIFIAKVIGFVLKKTPFPKKLLIATLSGGIIVSSIYFYEMYFFTFNEIDNEFTQKGPGPILSPTERYSANAHYELYGGAAGGVNVWVEITDRNNDEKTKTVYYGNANSIVEMTWADENRILIRNKEPGYPSSNKSIELNVENEIYHDTGLACQSLLMNDEYETCYQE